MKSRPLVPLLDTLDGKKQESFRKCTTVHTYLFRLGGWSVHRWYLYVHDRFYRLVELQLKRERFFVSSLFFCLPNARFVYILYTLVPYFQTLLMHFLILSIPPHYNNNYKKKNTGGCKITILLYLLQTSPQLSNISKNETWRNCF